MSVVTSTWVASQSPGWVTCYQGPDGARAFCERFDRCTVVPKEVTDLVRFGLAAGAWLKPAGFFIRDDAAVLGDYSEMEKIAKLSYDIELCFTGHQDPPRLACMQKRAKRRVSAIRVVTGATMVNSDKLALWLAVDGDLTDRFLRDLARIKTE